MRTNEGRGAVPQLSGHLIAAFCALPLLCHTLPYFAILCHTLPYSVPTLPLPLFCPLAHIETLWPQCWSLSWFQSQKNDFHGFKRTWLSVFLNPHQFNSGWVIWTWEMDWFGGLRFWPKTPVTSIYHPIWRQSSLSWQKTAFFVFSDFGKFQLFLGS